MSVLISPTKSKCSGISDSNSHNNGISNENANIKTPGLFHKNTTNGTEMNNNKHTFKGKSQKTEDMKSEAYETCQKLFRFVFSLLTSFYVISTK